MKYIHVFHPAGRTKVRSKFVPKFWSTAKNRVPRKMPPLLKFLTAQKDFTGEKAVAVPPKKTKRYRRRRCSIFLLVPRMKARRLLGEFSGAIYMDVN
ncbi:hypothetical protein [uncultured Paraglaciecola sp.]|uniref:hypothetical protein n=1 Tax=uncultured Paraglaciecola sp. TaxID=1765024 RepID=UPI00262FC783|nr:hypothetical protein [uncultured Paraglaciecola sp.]